MNKSRLTLFLVVMVFLPLLLYPSQALGIDNIDELLYLESEKTISLDFSGAKLNDVLKIFSQQSGLNFIAAADVASKTVNLYLEKVPVEQALERILSANKLTYEIDPGSNIFIVQEQKSAEKQLMTRVYPLKFATVPSSKLNTTLDFSVDTDTSVNSAAQSSSEGIISAVKSILSQEGSVVEDMRTNSLIVSDYPSQFPLIEQTIARLDIRIPQILIEAELLDISSETADLLGAKFGNTPLTFEGATRELLLPFNQNKAINNLPKAGSQGFAFTGEEFTTGTLSFAGLTVALQFLRTQTDTRNLARPRIRTLNNETAQISISTDEAIGVSNETTSAEGVGAATSEAERVQTGVFLKVTPQANVQTREITMAIEPRVVQARTGGTFGSGSSSQTFKDPEERGSKSILRVNDGDTIIIGGLLRTDLDDIKTRVPILSKIPILGAPFRHVDKTETQRELVIFITPHIIEEDIPRQVKSMNMYEKTREQTIPSDKKDLINKELSFIESQKFN